jgi:hypothetical protein
LVGAYLVFRAWDLSAYYEKTTRTSYGFLVVRLLVYVIPWAVMAGVAAAGIAICVLLGTWSRNLRDPSFSPGRQPQPPRRPSERKEAPIDDPAAALEAFCLGQIESPSPPAPARSRPAT